MAQLFRLSDEAWRRIEPHLPHEMIGQAPGRRQASDPRHPACAEGRLPPAGHALRLRPAHHDRHPL